MAGSEREGMNTRSEKGSFTIEAIMSLSLFMFAFVTIVSLAMLAKVESATQYAINQVAKEVSQYYYIAEKIGVTRDDTTYNSDIDSVVQAVVNFSDMAEDTVSEYIPHTSDDLEGVLDAYSNISNDVSEITLAAKTVYDSFSVVLENPEGVVASLATVMTENVQNELVSRIIAEPVCRALITKYIASNLDADTTLEKMGVVGGLQGLDFRMSSFLADKRSINVVLIYQVKINGFRLFDQTFTIKQTASTAAWITGASLEEAYDSVSIWSKDNFERGQEFVAEVKSENPLQAVKPGVGIDLYNQSTNTFTSVNSVNVFSASYSEYQHNETQENSASNYSIKKDKVKSLIKGYAKDLIRSIKAIDEAIAMDDGAKCEITDKNRGAKLIIVIPKEARSDSGNLKILNEIAKEIERETGVKVTLTYRESALGG